MLGWENDGPGDHDETDLDWDDIKTLCYEDATLVILPNPEPKRDLLAMEITLKIPKVSEEVEPVGFQAVIRCQPANSSPGRLTF